VAHGVHPTVKRVESAGLDSPPDRTRRESDRKQLRAADHPVLPLGEGGNGPVRSKVSEFGPDSGMN
jgi:hypothetical protein